MDTMVGHVRTNHVDKYNLAVLTIGDHPDLLLDRFADIYQKTLDLTTISPITSSTRMVSPISYEHQQEDSVPLQNSSNILDNQEDNFPLTNCTEPILLILDDVLKLHKEVSDDIEFSLRSSDQNFIKGYSKYLNTYHKIASKASGQAQLSSLSDAYCMYNLV